MVAQNNETFSESNKDMNPKKGSRAQSAFSGSIQKIFKEAGNEPVDLLQLLKFMENLHGDEYGIYKLRNQKLK